MGLEGLRVARLRFEMAALEDTPVPPFKGDLLRRALLWWLSAFWCPENQRCREGCRRPTVCMFGRVCQPTVDTGWPLPMQRLIGDTPPPAYTVWDDGDRRSFLPAGAPWHFELGLVGTLALQQIPAIIAAVQEGAAQGMGRERLRSRFRRVAAMAGGLADVERSLAVETQVGGKLALMMQDFRLADVAVTYTQGQEWADCFEGPVRGVSLRLLSPTKMMEKKEAIKTPELAPMMRALVRRLRILSQVYAGQEWPREEYGPLLDVAETARLEYHEMQWLEYARYSQRAGEHPVEGLIGQAWYTGDDLKPLLPALWLGQWLQMGKFYVIGNGRYTIEHVY